MSSAQRARSFLSSRRFRPRFVPTLAALIMVVLTVNLGNWQRHRAAEKDAMREQYQVAARSPEMDVDGREADPESIRYRPVRASGVFDAGHQVLIDNRIVDGRPGFEVVTPLKLGDGRYVLVDRGWIAQGPSRRMLPPVPPGAGPVTVHGRVNLPPRRYLELAKETNPGTLWQNLDIERLATATGLPLALYVIEQSAANESDGVLVRRLNEPALESGQHRSYMVQWYSLAALAIVLWLALNWRGDDAGAA